MLVHAVDDIIDRDNEKVSNYNVLVLDAFNLLWDLTATPFYQKNIALLYPLVKHIHRVYSASVLWEKEEGWKTDYADVLRCFGHDMIIAVLEHVGRVPYAEVRRIDLALRADSWIKQHDEKGQPT
jgi:hypothetical protein